MNLSYVVRCTYASKYNCFLFFSRLACTIHCIKLYQNLKIHFANNLSFSWQNDQINWIWSIVHEYLTPFGRKNINTIISFLVNLNTIYAKLSSVLYFVSDCQINSKNKHSNFRKFKYLRAKWATSMSMIIISYRAYRK